MRYDEFVRRATEIWNEIPAEFREGVDGLVVEKDASSHPDMPDVYTLGECATEVFLSDYGGPDTTRSHLLLYHGSFRRLAKLDADFDWESELWETIHHELQHHLESLANDDGLVDMDYAVDEGFKRDRGDPFDPAFYQSGEDLGDGWYRVEEDLYLERQRPEAGGDIAFELNGEGYAVRLPEEAGDTAFLDVVSGLPADAPRTTVVSLRLRSLGSRLRAALSGRQPTIVQADVEARTVR